ncbi:hypothetical protein AHAS_Ahas17G0016200 [Arachis hypogaea]
MENRPRDVMQAVPTHEEIRRAVFSMGSLKALGEDGFPDLFYKKHWNTIQDSVYTCITHLWEEPASIQEVNQTLITLIPKVNQPEYITQFRPIALCNVVYKCLSKILVERIKPTLASRIAPNQSSFIQGRMIHDNIIIAKEMVHEMRKMNEKECYMVVKIDFEKAYDRKCLGEFGIPQHMLDVIMAENECKTDGFQPTRGIRQGDPISPYLFVIAMDKLSQLIEEKVNRKIWKPIKAGRNGPLISHLLFADDLLLFAKADTSQMGVILDSLRDFRLASELKNVNVATRSAITNLSGFDEATELEKYLGAMLTNSRKKKDKYKNTLERVKSKLKGWKAHCLSIAGRVTLEQTVISPSINHDMMHSVIPTGICNEIEKLQRKFIWGEFLTVSLGDGRLTHLWKDTWLEKDEPLLHYVIRPVEEILQDIKVYEAKLNEDSWNIPFFRQYLDEDTIRKIQAILPPTDNLGQDRKKWKFTQDGNFSVAMCENGKAPKRLNASLGWLPTKSYSQHKGERVSLVRTLAAIDVKECLKLYNMFYEIAQRHPELPLILGFVGTSQRMSELPPTKKLEKLNSLFHNKELFSPPYQRPHNEYVIVLNHAHTIKTAFEKSGLTPQGRRHREVHVAWSYPPENWTKLNTDSAASTNPNAGGCGGVIRNEQGRWVAGFMANLVCCSAFWAEMWGIYHGLKIAWDLGLRRIIMESDSTAVVTILNKKEGLHSHLEPLVRSIANLMQKNWELRIENIYREDNKCTNWLAKENLKSLSGCQFIDSLPCNLRLILNDDCRGTTLPQFISIL